MVVIALLLLLLVVAIVVVMVMAGNAPVTLSWDAVNLNWSPTALVVYLLGAATLLLLLMAFAAMRVGARSRSRRRQELKRLRQMEKDQPSGPVHTAPRQAAAPPPPPTGGASAARPGDGPGNMTRP